MLDRDIWVGTIGQRSQCTYILQYILLHFNETFFSKYPCCHFTNFRMDDVFRIRSAPGTFWRHGNSRCFENCSRPIDAIVDFGHKGILFSHDILCFFSNLTSWIMKSGGKRKKKRKKPEKDVGESSIMILQHAVFFKKRRWHDEMHSHRGLAKKASGRRDETGHNRWI